MKIIYLHQYFKFPDERGPTRSYDLATSFAREGNDIIVVSSISDEQYKHKKRWSIVHRDGLEVHYIYFPYGNNNSAFKRILVFIQFLWFSTFKLLRLKGDVVLATSTPLTIGIPALIKKWRHKTPFIFEVRDVWPEAVIAIGAIRNRFLQKFLCWMEKLIYKNSSYIVPLSTDMQKSIITRFPRLQSKTDIVIPNISEINRFQNPYNVIDLKQVLGMQPRFSLLYAGTFGKVNGLDYVVRMAEKTIKLDPELVYILIGIGAYKESVKELAIKKNVYNKNVFILDPIAKNELPKWYGAVSMGSSFVINIKELWANSANKFFDTLAAAKPVLINHEGWQAEVIRKDNLGYVLPVEIDEEMAAEFVTYSKNTRLHDIQKENAFNKAKENYSLEVASKKYLEIFERILQDKK